MKRFRTELLFGHSSLKAEGMPRACEVHLGAHWEGIFLDPFEVARLG